MVTHMDASKLPKVCVGLPVYNGAPHIAQSVASLLEQDYPHFELIISDNASTDNTLEICQAYAERDSRVRIFRNEANIGSARNFNRVFELASGKYFMWAAHDDRWAPTYITRCVDLMERNDECVLCGSNIEFIDENGNPTERVGGYNRVHTASMELRERVDFLTRQMGWYCFYGLIRADALRKTRLFPATFGGDVVLLMELLFQGQFIILEEKLFTYRLVSKSVARYIQEIAGSYESHPPAPFTQLARDLLDVIIRSRSGLEAKQAMCDDLLENLTHRNVEWKGAVVHENPDLRNISPLLLPVEMKAVLVPALPLKALEVLRKAAVNRLAVKRLWFDLRRRFNRHIGWRLGRKASSGSH